jgi:hypothetical protein
MGVNRAGVVDEGMVNKLFRLREKKRKQVPKSTLYLYHSTISNPVNGRKKNPAYQKSAMEKLPEING